MEEHSAQAVIIVELISRLYVIDKKIGTYCGHVIKNNGIIAKTTAGTVYLPLKLIKKQLASPDSITDDDLLTVISTFSH